jgi:predicted secreted Zn-dependent protease
MSRENTLIRSARLAALGLALAFSAAPAAAEPPAAGSPFAGIPNVEIQYYDVTGRNPREIREAMNQARPTDPNDGLRLDALSRWRMGFGWPRRGPDQCVLDQARVNFTATVLMPRLVDAEVLPQSVRTRWQAYIAALETHEAGHVRHAWEAVPIVLAAIRASTCANAQEAGRAAVRAAAAFDPEYDRATRHGLSQGAHFP